MANNKADIFNFKRNLYYWLKHNILYDEYGLYDFSFHYTYQDLQEISIDSVNQNRYNFSDSNIVYWNSVDAPVIYRNGIIVNDSDYRINYFYGYVIFNDDYVLANPFDQYDIISATYSYITVDIRFRFSYEDVALDDLPIIVISIPSSKSIPVEIGSSQTEKIRDVLFQIYARNEIERDNLISLLESAFDGKKIQTSDYRISEPLDDDGFLNPSFNPPILPGYISVRYMEANEIYPSTPNKIDEYSVAISTIVYSIV